MFTAVLVAFLVLITGIAVAALLSALLGIEKIQTPTIVSGILALTFLTGLHVCVAPLFTLIDWRVLATVFLSGFVATCSDDLVHAHQLRRKSS